MGPYCKFCGNRCFVYFPANAPEAAAKAWGPGAWILATCAGGQDHDAKTCEGWSYSAILAAIRVAQLAQVAA